MGHRRRAAAAAAAALATAPALPTPRRAQPACSLPHLQAVTRRASPAGACRCPSVRGADLCPRLVRSATTNWSTRSYLSRHAVSACLPFSLLCRHRLWACNLSTHPPHASTPLTRRACYRGRHPKERGLLAGTAAGGASLAAAAYPLAAAIFGAAGLRVALLAGAVNSLAVWLGGYLLFATAGAAFPEQVGGGLPMGRCGHSGVCLRPSLLVHRRHACRSCHALLLVERAPGWRQVARACFP